jgi:hypothetical protein
VIPDDRAKPVANLRRSSLGPLDFGSFVPHSNPTPKDSRNVIWLELMFDRIGHARF